MRINLPGAALSSTSSCTTSSGTSLLNGGVFLAAFWWLWFEADKSGGHAQRRNVVVALLAVIGVAGALKLLKILLPSRYRPLIDQDLGLRLPFGVDPTSLNHFNAFPSGHAMLFFALCVPLWMRYPWLGAVAASWTLLAVCLPPQPQGFFSKHLERKLTSRPSNYPFWPAGGG
jgi:membrane-associated phospholipid phosphatase